MFTEFMDYKLRLTTKGVVNIERKLGKNPVTILLDLDEGKLPFVGDIVIILHEALQPYQHGLKEDDAYDILDKYADTGKTLFDFITTVLIDLYKGAGLISPDVNIDVENTEVKN